MPRPLTLSVAQSPTLPTTSATLTALASTAHTAAARGTHLLLFPEAYLGGYPRTCSFGTTIGSRSPHGREQFLHYFHSAVDFGDTPPGAGDAWVDRQLEVGRGKEYRGDGTRERLEAVARETGVVLVVGAVERAGGSLYCAVVYVCPRRGCVGKRRKVMPTGMERVVWAQGDPKTLRAVVLEIAGVRVTLAAAVCWESWMPLLRMSLYMQNVNLYCAPTADGRGSWVSLMRTVAGEGRCVVLSANQCVRRGELPGWVRGGEERGGEGEGEGRENGGGVKGRRKSVVTKTEDNHEITWPAPAPKTDGPAQADTETNNGSSSSPLRLSKFPTDDSEPRPSHPSIENAVDGHTLALPSQPAEKTNGATASSAPTSEDDENEFVSRGGSCIIGPNGDILAGPMWEETGLLTAAVDFEDCERGRLDLDVAGSYSRNDAFELRVRGLDLAPPP